MTPFETGRAARLSGAPASSNPHTCGTTKLGAARLTEAGVEWMTGWSSVSRAAPEAEVRAAASVDVRRFRRRSNRHYER